MPKKKKFSPFGRDDPSHYILTKEDMKKISGTPAPLKILIPNIKIEEWSPRDAEISAAIEKQSEQHRKEYKARESLKNLPTYQADDYPHHPWSNRCLKCGRWDVIVPGSENNMYGPNWICPNAKTTCR